MSTSEKKRNAVIKTLKFKHTTLQKKLKKFQKEGKKQETINKVKEEINSIQLKLVEEINSGMKPFDNVNDEPQDNNDVKYVKFALGLFIASFLLAIALNWGGILSFFLAVFLSLGIWVSFNIFLDISIKGVKLTKIHSIQEVMFGMLGTLFAIFSITFLILSIKNPIQDSSSSSSSSSSSGYSYCASVAEDDLRACMNRTSNEAAWRTCQRDYNYMMAGCTATE